MFSLLSASMSPLTAAKIHLHSVTYYRPIRSLGKGNVLVSLVSVCLFTRGRWTCDRSHGHPWFLSSTLDQFKLVRLGSPLVPHLPLRQTCSNLPTPLPLTCCKAGGLRLCMKSKILGSFLDNSVYYTFFIATHLYTHTLTL